MTFRIARIVASGFRGITDEIDVDLDADAVIIVGNNGRGKTSILDAMLWVLSGRVARLHVEDEFLKSLYASDGQIRVSLTLRESSTNKLMKVSRVFDGSPSSLTLETEDLGVLKGLAAQSKMVESLWPSALEATDPSDALSTALTRANYLQQDLLCQFIASDTSDQRFQVLAELLGVGRIRDLQTSLERAQRAYASSTTNLKNEAVLLDSQVSKLRNQLSEITEPVNADALFESWQTWWSGFHNVGGTVESPEGPGGASANVQIDVATRELTVIKDQLDRSRSQAIDLNTRVGESSTELLGDAKLITKDSLENELLELRERTRHMQSRLESERLLADERRNFAILEAEDQAELRTLAQLALRHLGDLCPVCNQTFDIESTQLRLNDFVSREQTGRVLPDPYVDLSLIIRELEVATDRMVHVESELSIRDARIAERNRIEEQLKTLTQSVAERLGVITDVPSAPILLDLLQDRIGVIDSLAIEAESLVLGITRLAVSSRRAGLEREYSDMKRNLDLRQADLQHRQNTRNMSGQIIEALREATENHVNSRLTQMAPLLQKVYSSIDPHPSLKDVRFIASRDQGKGRLEARLSDPEVSNVVSDSPPVVLSSSQANALAVSIFLTLNLGTSNAPLGTLILDDPLQSMDKVHLLSLVDVLRRTSSRRQLIVATHDEVFGQLLARKLRPVTSGHRTVVIRISNWDRTGIQIEREVIEPDLKRMAS
jgi:DNA repair exonuclease SbcCD ATPase subunit